ncbi:NADH dehydrogenase [ubiquinone] flavoprotein 3, mitochondrial [Mixophyes fleayi]|uniref:NADH dehydrogenase [ubiquinone] flavoprotein 3, mitochondrial n=1 Tax=Mixophyes fleayi TaxID=3061075 RepID=UPI003F4E284A
MAAPTLRAVRRLRLEAFLLPRINVTPVRAKNGGKRSSHTGISKTLVSFPVKFSNFQDTASGENRNRSHPEPLTTVHAPVPDAGSVSGQSEGDVQIGHEVSQQEIQRADKEPQQEDDSSSSSSDSESEEEEEDAAPAHNKKRESDGTSIQASDHRQSPTHVERPLTQEHKGTEVLKEKSAGNEKSEVLVDTAPSVAAEEQMTVVGCQSLGGIEKSEVLVDTAPSVAAEEQMTVVGCQSLGGIENSEVLVDTAPSVAAEEQTTVVGCRSLGGIENSEVLVDTAPSVAAEEQTTVVGCQSLGGKERERSEDGEILPVGPSSSDGIEATGTQILPSGKCEELPKGIEEEPAVSLSPPAPPAAPAPEEPFDNSKYQNEQHFSYTPFTFVEYDVELAKFRLPQPSSGRPSPRE